MEVTRVLVVINLCFFMVVTEADILVFIYNFNIFILDIDIVFLNSTSLSLFTLLSLLLIFNPPTSSFAFYL